MQFEIKEDRQTFRGHRFISRHTIGIKKLHADFHVAHMESK